MVKYYAVFMDYCDAAQEVFDSLEEAEKAYEKYCKQTERIDVFLCEVIKRTNREP